MKKNEVVSFFFLELRKFYLASVKYIQQNLFVKNKVLKSIATINSEMIITMSKSVMKYLMNLPSSIQVLEESEIEMYDVEVRKITVNSTVPLLVDSDRNKKKCLNWWIQVSSRCLTIFKVVTAILSIFNKIDQDRSSTFIKIDQVLDDKPRNMDVWMLDAIQTVKYLLNVNQVWFYLIRSIYISVYFNGGPVSYNIITACHLK